MHVIIYLKFMFPIIEVSLLQIVQFVRIATETRGFECRAAIIDACDTLLNLLIKVFQRVAVFLGILLLISLYNYLSSLEFHPGDMCWKLL